jgi:hypothetical protein
MRSAARLALISFLLAAPSRALEAAPAVMAARQNDTVTSATADLNGDGRPENIRLTSQAATDKLPLRYTLTINGVAVSGAFKDLPDEVPGFKVVQIDGGSKRREIMVVGLGPNDFHETAFYRWDGKKAAFLGIVPTVPEIKGNGAVYARIWMGFWSRIEKFVMDAKTGRLAPVPQPFYYVGLKPKVRTTFAIRRAPAAAAPSVASVAPGSVIEILLYQPPPQAVGKMGYSEENDWYLIRSETGLCGWVQMKRLRDHCVDLPFAG